jgi:hypothetical protein
LSAGAVPPRVDVGGVAIALQLTEIGRVARIEARPVELPPPAVRLDVLADLELGASGDSRLSLDAGGLLASRTVPEPDPARVGAAAQELATIAAAGLTALRAEAESDEARGRLDAEPPSPTPIPAPVEAYLARFRLAGAPQSAWLRADPSLPVHAWLATGQLYEVLQETRGWAQVAGDDGLLWWTDARTLQVPDEVAR